MCLHGKDNATFPFIATHIPVVQWGLFCGQVSVSTKESAKCVCVGRTAEIKAPAPSFSGAGGELR